MNSPLTERVLLRDRVEVSLWGTVKKAGPTTATHMLYLFWRKECKLRMNGKE